MSEFEFKKEDWEHPIKIVAETKEKAQERFNNILSPEDE